MKTIFLLFLIITVNAFADNTFELIPRYGGYNFDIYSQFEVKDTLYTCVSATNSTTEAAKLNASLASYKNRKWHIEVDYNNLVSKIDLDSLRFKLENLTYSKRAVRYFKYENEYVGYITLNSFQNYAFKYDRTKTIIYDSIYFNDGSSMNYSRALNMSINSKGVPYFIISEEFGSDKYHLCKLEDEKLKVVFSINKLVPKATLNTVFDNNDNYWLCFVDTLYYFENDIKKESFSISSMPVGGSITGGGYFTCVAVASDGKVFAMNNILGLYIYDGSQWTLDPIVNEIWINSSVYEGKGDMQDYSQTIIHKDGEGNIFIGKNYLYKYSNGKWEIMLMPNFNSSDNAYNYTVPSNNFYIDSKGRAWFFSGLGYKTGAVVYTPE